MSNTLTNQAEVILKEFYSVEILGDSFGTAETLDIVEFTLKKAAEIAGKPFYKIAPSSIEILPDSKEPVDQRLSQKEVFSFINDLVGIRAAQILGQ